MPLRVAIVDDEPVVCKRLSQALAKEGYAVEAFVSARSFLEAMIERPFDVVFSDMLLSDMNGLELLPKIKGLKPETEVIIVTGHGTISTAIEAMREGAFSRAGFSTMLLTRNTPGATSSPSMMP